MTNDDSPTPEPDPPPKAAPIDPDETITSVPRPDRPEDPPVEVPPERDATPCTPGQNPWRVLGIACASGFLIETLVHGQPAGLGVALAGTLTAAVALLGGPLFGSPPDRPVRLLAIPFLFFSTMAAVRSGAILTTFNLLACGALVLLGASLYRAASLVRLTLSRYAALLVTATVAALNPLVHLIELTRVRIPLPSRRMVPVLRGVLLALPLLLLFGSLFASADAIFHDVIGRLFGWSLDWGDLTLRIVFSLALSWAALGLLRLAIAPVLRLDGDMRAPDLKPLRLGAVEAVTALTLLNLLFLSFLAVQSAYLFGGADTLARTGMSHSTYARSGFFELVAVGAIVTGLVLASDWLLRAATGRARRAADALHAVLLVQTLAVLASALQRMRLYLDAYGQTELRFYTTVFMIWIAVVLAWMAATVLRRRRDLFPVGAIASGAVLMAAVNLMNPDAYIARTNLRREMPPPGERVQLGAAVESGTRSRLDTFLDTDYITFQLSPDAIPTLVEGIETVRDPKVRRKLASSLLEKRAQLEDEAAETSWRGWNAGRAAARRALDRAKARLRELAAEPGRG